MSSKETLLAVAKEAARMGGEILLKAFGKIEKDQIGLKGKGDYVTELDHRSEEAILGRIREDFPDHIMHAEESGLDCRDSEYRWLIDPLDGTANYVQGIPVYAVSIAVMKGKKVIVGVVYHPDQGELFWATRGGGAFLNGQPICVSSKVEMSTAMLASGFPWRSKQYLDSYMESFKRLLSEAAGVRRMGAAAVDLAYTACGRFDGFWEMKLSPWDIAAGILLIEEAGGVVTDFVGGKDFLSSGNVVAGAPAIHAGMLIPAREWLSNIP